MILESIQNPIRNSDVAMVQVANHSGELEIQVLDVLGTVYLSRRVSPVEGLFEVDLHSLPSSMYFLRVVNGENDWVRKIIKE